MRLIWLTTLLAPSVAFAGYEVSSYKKETKMGANFWNASAAIDDDLGTCWMVDPEGENENQWIEIGVPAGNVDKIALITGWAKDEATFKDYARVKSGRIEVYQGDTTDILLEHPVKFEDTPGWQLVDIPDTKVAGEIEGGRVRLVVTAVYSEGADFPNLGVSEFRVHMKEFAAQGISVMNTSPNEAGHDGELMTDGNNRSFWAADESENQLVNVDVGAYGVSSIGVMPGPKTHARPKTIQVRVNQNLRTYNMADKAEVQWFEIPALVGYTGSAWGEIELKVIDSYAGPEGKGVAIGEVLMKATNVDEF